jgi:hypothetical protein
VHVDAYTQSIFERLDQLDLEVVTHPVADELVARR